MSHLSFPSSRSASLAPNPHIVTFTLESLPSTRTATPAPDESDIHPSLLQRSQTPSGYTMGHTSSVTTSRRASISNHIMSPISPIPSRPVSRASMTRPMTLEIPSPTHSISPSPPILSPPIMSPRAVISPAPVSPTPTRHTLIPPLSPTTLTPIAPISPPRISSSTPSRTRTLKSRSKQEKTEKEKQLTRAYDDAAKQRYLGRIPLNSVEDYSCPEAYLREMRERKRLGLTHFYASADEILESSRNRDLYMNDRNRSRWKPIPEYALTVPNATKCTSVYGQTLKNTPFRYQDVLAVSDAHEHDNDDIPKLDDLKS